MSLFTDKAVLVQSAVMHEDQTLMVESQVPSIFFVVVRYMLFYLFCHSNLYDESG